MTELKLNAPDKPEGGELYKMREACLKAGHCLQLTKESDCELYPVKMGWCRPRVSLGIKQ